jgi:hypothetical protein
MYIYDGERTEFGTSLQGGRPIGTLLLNPYNSVILALEAYGIQTKTIRKYFLVEPSNWSVSNKPTREQPRSRKHAHHNLLFCVVLPIMICSIQIGLAGLDVYGLYGLYVLYMAC